MATKLEKCALRVNDEFTTLLKAAFLAKFKRELDTNYNIISMNLVSQAADGKPFTQEQKKFLQAYDDGYSAALGLVRQMANDR